MITLISCLFFFAAIAHGQDKILFPDELSSRLLHISNQEAPRFNHASQHIVQPVTPHSLVHFQHIQPPKSNGNPCYYNRLDPRCPPPSDSSNANANAHAHADANSNGNNGLSNAHADANVNSNGNRASATSNAETSDHSGFGNSNANAASQSYGNYDNNNNGYHPYPKKSNGGAASASSSASASSGLVGGVPFASSASASASASASSSGNYNSYGQPNSPWFYASRIGGTEDEDKDEKESDKPVGTEKEEAVVLDN